MNKETKQYILISLLPIIWYILAQDHSYTHCRYTYKSLILTLISLGIIDYKILKKEIKLKRKEEIK